MDVFVPKVVGQLGEFYGELLTSQALYPDIGKHLEAIALKMWQGLEAGDEILFHEISNYHEDHLGRDHGVLKRLGLNKADCFTTIANEYGFHNWNEVKNVSLPYDLDFETTVDAMLNGNLELLRDNIDRNPHLLLQRSRYGHGASLLHYAVSNGVEIWRQKVPMNLPEMVSLLLVKGANPKIKMKVYGGEYTAAELLLSSMHPRNAGIFEELRTIMDT